MSVIIFIYKQTKKNLFLIFRALINENEKKVNKTKRKFYVRCVDELRHKNKSDEFL